MSCENIDSAVIEIEERKSYICPYCRTRFSELSGAESCAKAGRWLENFREGDALWKWCVLGNKYGNAMAYMPSKIERKYSWAGNPPCRGRVLSFFNSFSNSYASIAPETDPDSGEWRIMEILSIREGFEKYRFVPPARYMGKIPDDARAEIAKVLEDAFVFRKNEIRDAFGGNAAILASQLACLTIPETFGGDFGNPADVSKAKETALICGERLLELDKWVLAFKREKE